MTATTTQMRQAPSRLRNFPVSFFATVMGLSGLTVATHKMEADFAPGLQLSLALFWGTAALFVGLASVYLMKLIRHADAVAEEWRHPVRISFFPAISISLILLGIAALPISMPLSLLLWTTGTAAHLLLTILVMTAWINHSRYEVVHTNPAWFIPVVGNILVPIAGLRHAPADLSWFFFAVGLLFWLVLLTIVFYRLVFHTPLPGRLVPTLAILLAPPSVGFISYAALAGGVDVFAKLLYFWAVLFFLLLVPQVGKFARQPFALSWWAFSFPLAAFTIATLVMADKTGTQLYQVAGIALFALLVVVILGLVIRTARAVARHEICIPEH